jgi:outer membrane receptor protein involved in Fe transport
VGALFTPAWHATGQDQPQEPGQQTRQQRQGLESITVTARKVEEDLQSVPVAVTAFDGAALQNQSITELGEISQQVPSLRWEDVPSIGVNPTITLRGLRQTNPLISADGAVGIYLDELYTARFAGTNSHLVDIERLEVLKGPQGTLYGRNTVGGAINIFSRRPTGELGENSAAMERFSSAPTTCRSSKAPSASLSSVRRYPGESHSRATSTMVITGACCSCSGPSRSGQPEVVRPRNPALAANGRVGRTGYRLDSRGA